MKHNTEIVKSNSFIEARYRLTVVEQKIILKMASIIEFNDADFKEYDLIVSDIIKEFSMSRGSGYVDLHKAINSLQKKLLYIKKANSLLDVGFISSAEYPVDKKTIKLCFDPKLKPYLLQVRRNFTAYSFRAVIGFQSFYTHRLYELLKQYFLFKKRYIPTEDLYFYLDFNKNTRYNDVKRHILYSREEMLTHSDIIFDIEEVRQGRKVKGILFKISPNESFIHEDTSNTPISITVSTDPTSLPNQIWQWIYQWEQSTGKQMTVFDREQSGKDNKTISYLNLLISKLSESKVRALWNEECAKPNPNPIYLLTKRLREELYKVI